MKNIVVDASAIINGVPMLLIDTRYLTSPSVIDEIKSRRGSKNLRTAIELNMIEQRIPQISFLEKVLKAANETKDNLSEQDAEIIALALEFNANIATDDYGIQNVAGKIGIKIIPVAERGIKKILHWQHYCPACKRKYDLPGICGICGTKLKRKAKKRH